MNVESGTTSQEHKIFISDEVKSYILQRKCDFRICTTCGGPILLSTSVKPPKSTDFEIYVEDYIIYISMYQARFMDRIDSNMIPKFCDYY